MAEHDDDLRDEYDFRGGERGKYADRYREGHNLVRIDPDLLRYFPDTAAVNSALHHLVEAMRMDQRAG